MKSIWLTKVVITLVFIAAFGVTVFIMAEHDIRAAREITYACDAQMFTIHHYALKAAKRPAPTEALALLQELEKEPVEINCMESVPNRTVGKHREKIIEMLRHIRWEGDRFVPVGTRTFAELDRTGDLDPENNSAARTFESIIENVRWYEKMAREEGIHLPSNSTQPSPSANRF